jgi:uncharacterized lipoprotein
MKTLLAALVVLSLAGCGDGSYYRSSADEARDNAYDAAVGAAIMSNYATSPRSCMNIGGIVTCQ